jgi:hypothetical protein
VTTAPELLVDAFSRIRDGVTTLLEGVDARHLTWRPGPDANTIAWLVWHLTRIEDDHLAAAFSKSQVWHSDGWSERFGLPYRPEATGYGMSPSDVGALDVGPELLSGYHLAVASRTTSLLAGLSPGELDRVVDERWDPPVTLAVRLVSVVADGLEHLGQAAYIRGLAEQAG